jgi:hypothetical protein
MREIKHDAAKLAEPGAPAREWIYTAAKFILTSARGRHVRPSVD